GRQRAGRADPQPRRSVPAAQPGAGPSRSGPGRQRQEVRPGPHPRRPGRPHRGTFMTGRTLAAEYLSAIERGDLDAIPALFHPGATVHSPLYGPLPATEFYPRLLADTAR